MSDLDIFTADELKKIIKLNGLQPLIKMTVPKKSLIGQMEKFLDFQGFNFKNKDNNQEIVIPLYLIKKKEKQPQPTKIKPTKIKIKKKSNAEEEYMDLIAKAHEEYKKQQKPKKKKKEEYEQIDFF